MPQTVTTARLHLVPIPRSCATATPDEREPIARATGARVPESWPVEHYDQEMLDFVRAAIDRNPNEEYTARYIVLVEPEPTVIGMAGCMPPDDAGAVVIGYSVLPEFRQRGYASEALRAMIDFARRDRRVRAVVGFTYPELVPSIRTMERCGMRCTGPGAEERTIRFELRIGDS